VQRFAVRSLTDAYAAIGQADQLSPFAEDQREVGLLPDAIVLVIRVALAKVGLVLIAPELSAPGQLARLEAARAGGFDAGNERSLLWSNDEHRTRGLSDDGVSHRSEQNSSYPRAAVDAYNHEVGLEIRSQLRYRPASCPSSYVRHDAPDRRTFRSPRHLLKGRDVFDHQSMKALRSFGRVDRCRGLTRSDFRKRFFVSPENRNRVSFGLHVDDMNLALASFGCHSQSFAERKATYLRVVHSDDDDTGQTGSHDDA
jgi:hypothetical protein